MELTISTSRLSVNINIHWVKSFSKKELKTYCCERVLRFEISCWRFRGISSIWDKNICMSCIQVERWSHCSIVTSIRSWSALDNKLVIWKSSSIAYSISNSHLLSLWSRSIKRKCPVLRSLIITRASSKQGWKVNRLIPSCWKSMASWKTSKRLAWNICWVCLTIPNNCSCWL